MPRGDKSSYTSKQKRQAEHIEEGYEKRGTSKKKRNAAPGQRSTKKPTAASAADQAAEKPRTIPHRAKAAERIGPSDARDARESR